VNQEHFIMKRFLLMAASIVALGMAAPAKAQALGPNDAFIDQIGDSNRATASQAGSSAIGNGPDIDQINGNAAEVTQAGKGALSKSAITQAANKAAYVIQLRADHPNDSLIDRHGVARNDASVAEAGEGHSARMSPQRAQAMPTTPPSSGRAQAGGGGPAGAGTSPR
jgi:hypothetical protein